MSALRSLLLIVVGLGLGAAGVAMPGNGDAALFLMAGAALVLACVA